MKKKDGFSNQIMIVVPPENYQKSDDITGQLYLTDIGIFPKAEDHLVSRLNGCESEVMIICTGGNGWFEFEGRRFELKKDEAIILPAGIPHEYGTAEGEWWEIFWIHFGGNLSGAIRDGIRENETIAPFPLPFGQESRHIFSLICSSLQVGISPMKYDLACARLWHLMGSIRTDRKAGSELSRGTINECISMMEDRINGSLTLEELSHRISMTPQYLCRLFKQKTGHTPMEHFTRLKIQKACYLLDMTSDQVNEISSQIGIDDPYYFTRTFKRIMGTPPRDYRNRQK
ncbi:MAG: helix-turn-helix domain-containing protein [Spirochaetales bacterium]|nr:helix-turn-helix domain-containing protein [Spirochaetales bacterium]